MQSLRSQHKLTICKTDRRLKTLTSVACEQCGLIRTDPMPTDAELDAYYAGEYRLDYQFALSDKPPQFHLNRSQGEAETRLALLQPRSVVASACSILAPGPVNSSPLRPNPAMWCKASSRVKASPAMPGRPMACRWKPAPGSRRLRGGQLRHHHRQPCSGTSARACQRAEAKSRPGWPTMAFSMCPCRMRWGAAGRASSISISRMSTISRRRP